MPSVRSGAVSTPSRLRGLPQDQACEALSIGARLDDARVFVLMGCLHFGKSGSLRVFRRGALESRPSIARPLQEAGYSVENVTASLLRDGFLLSAGFGRISLSVEATIVEHRFSILADYLRLKGVLPPAGLRPKDIATLRDYMRRVCDGLAI